jgi:NADP-dependent 3-hydroxy acid dehydrogenase YdfG
MAPSDAYLEETSSLSGQLKGQFEGIVVNIAEKAAVGALPEDVLARFGTVDRLINNAGIIQRFTRLDKLDYSIIELVFNVNFLARCL